MTRYPRLSILSVALLAGFSTSAVAGTIADKAAEAEAAIAAGDHVAAWAAVGAISEEAWAASPEIRFTNVALAIERSVDYGIYNPRPDNKYTQGEPIVIYTEPWGYGFGSAGEGLYSVNFAIDLELLTEAGENLGSLKDIAKFDVVARVRRTETSVSTTFNLNGVSPGKFTLNVTMRDMNSTKVGTFSLPIEIVE